MIVLDTNIISEPLRTAPDPRVLIWLDQQDAATLFVTTITVAELFSGVANLPDGRRKTLLEADLGHVMETLFGERILSFDLKAAQQYAKLIAEAKAHGRAIGFADVQIAAIAKAHGFSVATRDTGPYEAAGIPVINPWSI